MKKTLLFTLAATTAAMSSFANAQSSVTLYGVIDTGIDFVSNQKSASGAGGRENVIAEAGNLNTDRWGLRGSEDLGGGLKAIFDLENGFNVNSGKFNNGGDEFGRQAWIGLSSSTFGQLTLGRQYDAVVDYVAPLSATGSGFGGNLAEHAFDNDNLSNDIRLNNSVKIRSADYSGFGAEAVYAFSNQAGGFANNNAFSAGAHYSNGPVSLGVGYLQINQPGGVNAPANTSGAVSSSDGDAVLTGARQRIYGAAGDYTFGGATVGLVFTRTTLGAPTGVTQGGSLVTLKGNLLSFDNYEVNAHYMVLPMLSLGGSYTFTDGHFGATGVSASPKWNQFMLQADYSLSRRTDVYLEGVYQHVSGADGLPALSNASIFSLAASANDKQAVVGFGIRHKF